MSVLKQKPVVTGVGLGFRSAFAETLLEDPQAAETVAWIEIHPENYARRGGRMPALLERAAGRWSVLAHGLTLCFGDEAQLDESAWVADVRDLLQRHRIPFYTDHLCWSAGAGAHSHDLLPLPRTEAVITHAADRITRLRDGLGVPIAVENVSEYTRPRGMDEATFVSEVLERADALLLLDVNNIVVNAHNGGFDPMEMLLRYPLDRVAQIHVAGHWCRPDGLRVDTHGEDVGQECLRLLEAAVALTGPVPVLLERDSNAPPLPLLMAELERIRASYDAGVAAFERGSSGREVHVWPT